MKRLIKKIRNIIRWLPVLWKDEDWDYSFFYDILKFKIQNIAKHTKKYSQHTNAYRDIEWMNTACRLIDRLSDDYYYMEYLEYYSNPIEFTKDEDVWTLSVSTKKDNLGEYFNKYKRHADKIKAKSDVSKAILVGYNNHDRAKRLLFKILENKMEGWWY